VEYPDVDHPAHQVARETKLEVRRRLRRLATEMGASDPALLGDGLMMLLEGAYVSRQVFGNAGPASSLARMANRLIDKWPLKSVVRRRRARQKLVRRRD
jgi:hypothetical protein